MRGNGIAYHATHAVALRDVAADQGVRSLHLVVDGLTDVVQQAALLGLVDVGPDLGRKHRRQMRRLDRVVQDVLAVAGPILEPAQQLDQLRVQARHAGVVRRLLARLAHDDLDLGAALGDSLLDPARMDASVGDELGECHARHFAADRVEAREDHRLGRVVDDQVHAGSLLERADVAALTADDATLHLLRGQGDHRDGRLGSVIRGDALHDRGQDAARLFVALLNRAALDLAHPMLGFGFRLVHDLLDHRLARLDHRQPAYPLQRRQLLSPQVGYLAPFGLQLGQAFLGGGLATLQRLELTVEALRSVE